MAGAALFEIAIAAASRHLRRQACALSKQQLLPRRRSPQRTGIITAPAWRGAIAWDINARRAGIHLIACMMRALRRTFGHETAARLAARARHGARGQRIPLPTPKTADDIHKTRQRAGAAYRDALFPIARGSLNAA